MIAGGTGITPMLQIIRAALKNPLDRTKLSLIYANVNPEDILLKMELDELAAKHASRFKVYYVLNNPAPGWTGGAGFVSKEQIEKYMPPTDTNIKVLMCGTSLSSVARCTLLTIIFLGPPAMMTAMKKHLAELNYPAPRTVSKLADQVELYYFGSLSDSCAYFIWFRFSCSEDHHINDLSSTSTSTLSLAIDIELK